MCALPNNPEQQNSPSQSQSGGIYVPQYVYPGYYYSPYVVYYAYPPPKYYYETYKYTVPYFPGMYKPNPKYIKYSFLLLFVLAVVNLIAGGILLYGAYDDVFSMHTVSVSGEIVANSTVLENVKITVLGENFTLYSDENGRFEVNLTTGNHEIIFEKSGYKRLNATLVVGRYLDNNVNVIMEEGEGNTSAALTQFTTMDDYIANLLVSGTMAVIIGCFALCTMYYLRAVKYRSLAIASATLGIFSIIVLSGLATVFMLFGIASIFVSLLIYYMVYHASDLFIQKSITTADTD
jgi:hypothetical protein